MMQVDNILAILAPCHPERSEGSPGWQRYRVGWRRSFAALRM